jgi:hypothetical protein
LEKAEETVLLQQQLRNAKMMNTYLRERNTGLAQQVAPMQQLMQLWVDQEKELQVCCAYNIMCICSA